MKQIQWFPGHMTRALREIKEKLKLVDIVVELRDARIPVASANPRIKEIIGDKPHLIVLTKKDLADPEQTKQWITYFKSVGKSAIAFNMQTDNINQIVAIAEVALKEKFARDAAKGMKQRRIKAMVVGIPNVGKSTFINRLSNKKVTTIGNKPGITKKQQWIRIHKSMDLLDTPGVLWPKFDNPVFGMRLAAIGSIKDDILPLNEVIKYVLEFMQEHYPKGLFGRFPTMETDNVDITRTELVLETIAKERRLLTAEGTPDVLLAEKLFLNELRAGMFGGMTFDGIEDATDDDL